MNNAFSHLRFCLLGISILSASCGTPTMPDASDDVASDRSPVGDSGRDASTDDGIRDVAVDQFVPDTTMPPEDAGTDTFDDSTPDVIDVIETDAFDATLVDVTTDDGIDATLADVTTDDGIDATLDVGTDTATGADSGTAMDVSADAAGDAGPEAAIDAGPDVPSDTATDSGTDAGPAACTSTLVAPVFGGGTFGSVVFDSAGDPHVLYVDMTDRALRHATRSGGVWTREVVDSNFVRSTSEVLGVVRSAIDSRNRIHIAYVVGPVSGSTAFTERYGVLDAGSWTMTTIGPTNTRNTAIVVDSRDVPYVSTRTAVPTGTTFTGNTWLSSPGPSGWTTTRVDATIGVSDVFGNLALAVDGLDRVWVAFDRENSSMPSVTLCEPGPTGWTSSVVRMSTTGGILNGLAMAVDATGSVAHIVSGNHYSFGAGAFWSNETLTMRNASGNGDYAPVIRLDSTGTPVIVHGDWTGTSTAHVNSFVVQQRQPTGWTRVATYAFDPGSSGTTRYDVTGVDPAGYPYFLGPYAAMAQRMALSLYPAGVQATTDVDFKERVTNRGVVAVPAPSGSVTIAAWLESELRIYDVDPLGNVTRLPALTGLLASSFLVGPALPAVAFGTDGMVRVGAITLASPRTPRFSRWTGTSWATSPPVPAAGLSDAEEGLLAMSLDSAQDPHVVYVRDSSTRDIYYSSYVGGAWTTESVQHVRTFDEVMPQLVFGAADSPYVAYYAYNALQFARRLGGTWAVANLGPVDTGTAAYRLYIDRMNRPCVAYPVASPNRLIKSCLVGSAFVTETIADSATTPAPWTPIVVTAGIDSAGREYVLANDGGLAPTGGSPGTTNVVRFTFDGTTWVRSRAVQFARPPLYRSAATMTTDHRIHQVRDPGEDRWWDEVCAP